MLKPLAAFLVLAQLTLAAAAAPSADLDAQVVALGDPDFAVREAATDALLLDPALTPADLAKHYAAAELPEVRHRLRQVAEHQLLQALRQKRFGPQGPGSIGVVQTLQVMGDRKVDRMELPEHVPQDGQPLPPPSPLNLQPGDDVALTGGLPGGTVYALITRVLPGFPANGRLRPLDQIVAVDGVYLDLTLESRRFDLLMRRFQAGENLPLTVVRDGRVYEFIIPLANGTGLANMYGFPDFGLSGEFQQAWDELQRELFPES